MTEESEHLARRPAWNACRPRRVLASLSVSLSLVLSRRRSSVVCVASYTLLWAASVAACLVAAGASGAADATTDTGRQGAKEGGGREGGERGIGTGGCGGNCATQPRARRDGQGRHACCEGTTAFAGTKGMSPHYLLEIRTDFSHFFLLVPFGQVVGGVTTEEEDEAGRGAWRLGEEQPRRVVVVLSFHFHASQYTEKTTSIGARVRGWFCGTLKNDC